jgi:NhaP-type Na+/H+ or K+/H+ antiporter
VESTLILFGVIGAVGLAAQWFSWRVQIPSIFALLIGGLLLGPITGYLDPEKLFGHLLIPIISLAVAIILFEGSLTLVAKEVRSLRSIIIRLVTVGLLISWVLSSIAIFYLTGLDWHLSICMGAILSISGPTVMSPLLKNLNLRGNLRNIFHWESITIDAIGAALALLVFTYSVSTLSVSGVHFEALEFVEHIAHGLVIGFIFGYALGRCIRAELFPTTLLNMFALIAVIVVYVIGSLAGEAIGLISVATMGITMSNMKELRIKRVLNFKENLSLVLISGVFILLASQVDLKNIQHTVVPSLILFAVLQFIVRPIVVLACSVGSTLPWRSRLLLAWIFPRGIVGAAIAAVFTEKFIMLKVANAELLLLYTFSIIIISVVWQTLTAKPLAKLLRLVKDSSCDVLVVGSNKIAREVARLLIEKRFNVLMVDNQGHGLRQAKRLQIPTLFGKIIQLQAEKEIELRNYDHVFLLPTAVNKSYPLYASMRLRIQKAPIYAVTPYGEALAANTGDCGVDLDKARLSVIELKDDFIIESFQQQHPGLLPLFALSEKKSLYSISAVEDSLVAGDWIVAISA